MTHSHFISGECACANAGLLLSMLLAQTPGQHHSMQLPSSLHCRLCMHYNANMPARSLNKPDKAHVRVRPCACNTSPRAHGMASGHNTSEGVRCHLPLCGCHRSRTKWNQPRTLCCARADCLQHWFVIIGCYYYVTMFVPFPA